MANTIKQKRGTTDPSASDLVVGELAINTTDGGVFTKTDGGTVVEVGAGGAGLPSGGSTDQVLLKNSNTDYDTVWSTGGLVPTGGTGGWVLSKNSSSDYDTTWVYPGYLPSGGTSGQVLKKATSYLYDAYWTTVGDVPSGGSTSQVLAKSSSADYATNWADVSNLIAQDKIAKAWINFKGTGTVTIRDSYNVSSVTDEGQGLYQVNFSSSIGHSNYSAVVSGFYDTSGGTGGVFPRLRRSAFNAFYVKIESINIANGSGRFDSDTVTCIVFG